MSKQLLVACEESQAVTKAFRDLGYIAFSCDLQDCSGDLPQFHFKADCKSVLEWYSFDMIIAFPPCTYLSKAGAVNLFNKDHSIKNFDRFHSMEAARDFFYFFYDFPCEHICIENPVPMKVCGLPLPSQIINPWQFGHDFMKRTCLWLKGLPPLMSTDILPASERSFVYSHSSSKLRSKTFSGIAEAMANQWGCYLE